MREQSCNNVVKVDGKTGDLPAGFLRTARRFMVFMRSLDGVVHRVRAGCSTLRNGSTMESLRSARGHPLPVEVHRHELGEAIVLERTRGRVYHPGS